MQHWIVSPLQTHYLTMVIALYEGITRRNAATIVLQHVSVLCRYSIRRAERSSLSPALALYSTGSLPLSTRLISLPFSRPRRGNSILLIKQGAPGHGAQMQFVTISRSQDFDYTRALYADQRLLTTVNPPLKPIRSLLAPDHAHLRLSDPPTSLLCKKKKK